MPATTKLIGAALPTFCFYGAASAQAIDPGANRLPLFPNDVCGAGSEGRGAAAYFAVGSPSELAGVSGRLLRHVFDSVLGHGGWVLLTGHWTLPRQAKPGGSTAESLPGAARRGQRRLRRSLAPPAMTGTCR